MYKQRFVLKSISIINRMDILVINQSSCVVLFPTENPKYEGMVTDVTMAVL